MNELFVTNFTTLWFGVQVVWRVRESAMRNQVKEAEGIVTFGPGIKNADLTINLRKDQVRSRDARLSINTWICQRLKGLDRENLLANLFPELSFTELT